jgi:hypothetical protein
MKSPKLLSAALRLLWIGQNNRLRLPAFGGKANFVATSGNTRRLRMRKTTIRMGALPVFTHAKRYGAIIFSEGASTYTFLQG